MSRRANPQLSPRTNISRPEGRIGQYLLDLAHSPWELTPEDRARLLELSFLAQELFTRHWIDVPSCVDAAQFLGEIDGNFPYERWNLDRYDHELLSFARERISHYRISLDDLLLLPVVIESEAIITRNGMVYTPSTVARWMVERILTGSGKEDPPLTILDPAVGTGVFLREALARSAFLRGIPRGTSWGHLTHSLYGIDRDERALRLTRVALLLDSFAQAPKAHEWSPPQLFLADTLLDPWNSEKKTFDLVIGNPPYRLGRGSTIEIEERMRLRSEFKNIITGRINSYPLFMAKGFSLLADHGTLSMLVPNAWLGIKEGLGIRSLFLEHEALAAIDLYPQSVFLGTGVEVISFVARRGTKSTTLRVRHHLTENFASTEESTVAAPCNASEPIVLVGDPSLSKLQSILKEHSAPLHSESSPLRARIALQVYALGRGVPPQTQDTVESHPFHSASPIDTRCVPYLEGKSISAFHIAQPASYLRYGEWMAEHQPFDLYTRPRILVREVLSSLSPRGPIAATCTVPAAYNRSVLHIHTEDDSLETLYALTGILNSSFAALILTLYGRKSMRRLFPKILLADLAAFPVPQGFFSPSAEKEELARLSRHAHGEHMNAELGFVTNATLMRALDQQVAAIYQVPYPLLAEATQVVIDRLGMVS